MPINRDTESYVSVLHYTELCPLVAALPADGFHAAAWRVLGPGAVSSWFKSLPPLGDVLKSGVKGELLARLWAQSLLICSCM